MTDPSLVRLDECCQIVSGATPKTEVSEYWDGEILWATPKDLSNLPGKFIDDTSRKINKAGLSSCSAIMLPVGSVLLSSRAPIGHVAINTRPMATNQGFKNLIPKARLVDAAYLYHWLRANRVYLESLGNGATFKEISKAVVAKIQIPLPPLHEQRLIAKMLDQIDDLRAKRREAIVLLDDLAQSIFLDMFNESTGVPIVQLGDRLSFVTSGGRGWAKYYSDQGARFIRSLDVRMNAIDERNAVYVTPPDNAEARRTRIQVGDVLLTITGSLIGRVAPVSIANQGSYVSQHVAILRPDQDRLVSEFLAFYLSLPTGGQAQISRMQYGQTKPGLNFEQIRDFHVPMPSIGLQNAFVERLNLIRTVRATHDGHLNGLDSLFGSLKQSAFGWGPLRS